MKKKERLDLILSKVAEDKKEAFIAELRGAQTKEERKEILGKYGITLTKEEAEAMKNKNANELSDEDLDQAAGGCSCSCDCACYMGCG